MYRLVALAACRTLYRKCEAVRATAFAVAIWVRKLVELLFKDVVRKHERVNVLEQMMYLEVLLSQGQRMHLLLVQCQDPIHVPHLIHQEFSLLRGRELWKIRT